VVIPGRTNVLFDGTVVYTKGVQAEINVALKNAFRDPVTVQGKLGTGIHVTRCLTEMILRLFALQGDILHKLESKLATHPTHKATALTKEPTKCDT